MSDYGDLHIIDLGAHRPPNYRYGVGTAEPDPHGGAGRWIRVAAEGDEVHHRVHLPRAVTSSVGEIIVVTDEDEVTG